MDRKTFGRQFLYLFRRMKDFFFAFTRKSEYDIGVNVVHSDFSCKRKSFDNIFDRMSSSDDIQRLLIHRLRIYRNTRYVMGFQYSKLININRIGSSGFHCKLFKFSHIDIPFDHAKQLIKLACVKRCRRSATYIYRIKDFTLSCIYCKGKFLFDTADIFIKAFFVLNDRIGCERAIQACRGAERNADVDAVSFILVDKIDNARFALCYFDRKKRLFITDEIGFLHVVKYLAVALFLV